MTEPPQPEQIGPLQAERHRLRTADDVPLVVTRIPPEQDAHATPVVLIYGTYSQRNFWVSPKGVGLAPCLAGRGFDTWVPDLRGHGLSPKTERFGEWTAEDHMREDLPAVQALIRKVRGGPAFWIGHSAGGLYILGAIAAGWLEPDLRGAVVLGAQIARGDRILKLPPAVWLMRLMMRIAGHFPAPRLGMGNEVEPPGEMLEYVRWKGLRGRWETRDGRSYHQGMKNVTAPVLAFGAAADTNDPPEGCRLMFEECASDDKRFVLLSQADGFGIDYGHVEMVISKQAQAEVWPLIAEWLEERR